MEKHVRVKRMRFMAREEEGLDDERFDLTFCG